MLSFLDRVDDRNANRLEKQAQYRRDLEQQMREKENLTQHSTGSPYVAYAAVQRRSGP